MYRYFCNRHMVIVRAIVKNIRCLNCLLKVLVWLFFIICVFLQVLTVIYIYLGIEAGFFSL